MVKVIWRKTAAPPQTGGSIVFARWRQYALPCGHIGATWQIQLNLCFLRPAPARVHNPNGKLIASAVSAQLMAESPYALQNCPFSWGGGSEPLHNSWFLVPVRAHNPNGITIGSAVCAQVTAECPYTLQLATLPPSKFSWNWCSSFNNMQVWIFYELGLKMPFVPQVVLFGDLIPNWGQSDGNRQKAPPCMYANTSYICPWQGNSKLPGYSLHYHHKQ